MDVATKRAFAAKAYLEAQGYEIYGGNGIPGGYTLAVLAEREGSEYVSAINLIGNAVVINTFALSYGADDFESREEAVESIPLIMDSWLACFALINGKMDGLCSLTVKSSDATTMSISGISRGYYLKDTGASEYICKLLDQALTNVGAGMSLAESYLEVLADKEAE